MTSLPLSLTVQKKALRKSVAAVLQALSRESITEQSQAVTRRVLSLPEFARCRSFSCYLSMPTGEINTGPLVAEALKLDKILYVPKIVSSARGEMDFLKVYSSEDLDSLPRRTWGIREPDIQWQGGERSRALDEMTEPLDIILLPGVAFDHSMSRLGHGKGYYDRFITSYMSLNRPKPLLVALALTEQVLEADQVPIGGHDWKVDMIITPYEVISKGNN